MALDTIHPAYKLFFLWIEPIGIFIGGLQAIFFPIDHLLNFTPIAIPAIRPEYAIVIYQLGACEVFMAGVEGLVLRGARNDQRVWSMVLCLMLLADIVHGYGLWMTMGSSLFTPSIWRWQEYMNVVLLSTALLLRPGFLLGIGVKTSGPPSKKRN